MDNTIKVFDYNNEKIQKYLFEKMRIGQIRIIIMLFLSIMIVGMVTFINGLSNSFLSKIIYSGIIVFIYILTYIFLIVAYYRDRQSYFSALVFLKGNNKIQLYLDKNRLIYPKLDEIGKRDSNILNGSIPYNELDQIVIWINRTPFYKEIIFKTKQNGQNELITIDQILMDIPIERIADLLVEMNFSIIVLTMKQDYNKEEYVYNLNQIISGKIKFPLSLIKYEFHKKGNIY